LHGYNLLKMKIFLFKKEGLRVPPLFLATTHFGYTIAAFATDGTTTGVFLRVCVHGFTIYLHLLYRNRAVKKKY